MKLEDITERLDRKKTLKITAITLFSAVFLLTVSALYIDSQQVERDIQTQNVSFTVLNNTDTDSNETNINITTGDHFRFGKMPNGTRQRRYMNWSSDAITLATVKVDGNASKYLEFNELNVFQGRERFQVEMQAEKPGHYQGVMQISFQAPKTRWALRWLKLKSQYAY